MLNYPMTNFTSNRHDLSLERAQHTSMANKRWLLVGAQQAGASERRMAELAQLPRATVRRILCNFKRTGVPSLSPRQRCKGEIHCMNWNERDGRVHGDIGSELTTFLFFFI